MSDDKVLTGPQVDVQKAERNLSGVGLACFVTTEEQDRAFGDAWRMLSLALRDRVRELEAAADALKSTAEATAGIAANYRIANDLLRDENARLRSAIVDKEWAGNGRHGPFCVWCGGVKREDYGYTGPAGHLPGCLVADLAESKDEKP